MPKATIDDVAKLAGVSIKTVSRVVNREPNVRESTRDNVERAISELNYRPNQAAQNLASHRSHLIVLIYDDPSAYEIPSAGYIIRMQEGALRACRTANYVLLIHPCRYRNKDVGNELRALIEQVRPDGIVLAAPLSNVRRIVTAIEETGTPLVRVSPGKKNGGPLSVVTNDRETCAEMTRFLASLGHKKIAFITGHPEHKAVGNRFLGYKDGLDQSGLIFSEGLVAAGDNSIRSGEACAAALLESEDPPTAIFAANDDMAAGVIRVADRLDIKVPEQLSVAGCDDIALAQQVYPALTTINQPLAGMADEAVMLLIDSARKKRTTQQTAVVAGTLKIRESTGPAPQK
ncbi:MAG: LacI family DNA-binding transcriptional regulator [Gammaproteobacteria bacterium]|nr:LacI family DNA-binding transcriptional regulator [Gammaproteobacteria bacterium]